MLVRISRMLHVMKHKKTFLRARNYATAFVASALCMLVPYATQAYTLTFDPNNTLQNATGLGDQDPAFIVFTVVNTLLIFLGTLTLIMIVVAGFMWLTAGGSEEKISKAKEILQGTVIGLVIVFSSFGLAQFVFSAIQQATLGTP